jgi:cardiolipin synthase
MAERLDAPAAELSSRIWTIPNVLSMLRLAGVPVFLYWVLVTEQDGRAILLLMAAGASDYFDGLIARKYGLFTRLGQLLDPLADRLYILATLLALVYRDGLPLWWALTLIGRDGVLSLCLPVLRRYGYGPLPVHFLGKAATFNLLYAFPMLLAALPRGDADGLLGDGSLLATVFRPLGWAFATWGSVLYLWAGVLYVVQVRQVVREARSGPTTEGAGA